MVLRQYCTNYQNDCTAYVNICISQQATETTRATAPTMKTISPTTKTTIHRYCAMLNACAIEKHKECTNYKKIVNEYDQEIPQSQTADNPVAPRGRAAQPSLWNRLNKLPKRLHHLCNVYNNYLKVFTNFQIDYTNYTNNCTNFDQHKQHHLSKGLQRLYFLNDNNNELSNSESNCDNNARFRQVTTCI